MLWKKKLQSVAEPADTHCGQGKASVVGVHELYENDELLQDWKDVYITSAYLIWCQTNRVIICTYTHAIQIVLSDYRSVIFRFRLKQILPEN